ncbi:MAG: hypothetical protein WA782_04560 [Sulfitobacter sp.]
MRKFLLAIGLIMTTGSGAVGYDFVNQAASHAPGALTLESYGAQLPQRLTSMAQVNAAKASNVIPQIRETWTGKSWSEMSNDEQIASFTADNPQLRQMVAADKAAARQSFWASVRQKASPKDKQSGNRLGDIKARTAARAYQPTVQPSDLSGMSAAEIYSNRAEISRSFSAIAAENMTAASKGH